ncbi:MAG: hypothetical protein ABI560_17265 [Myxococcales bacterium]
MHVKINWTPRTILAVAVFGLLGIVTSVRAEQPPAAGETTAGTKEVSPVAAGLAPAPAAASTDQSAQTPALPPVPATGLPDTISGGAQVGGPSTSTAGGPRAPIGPAPAVEMPSERDMPVMNLPRETAVENPLGRAAAFSGTAIGGYGELTLNAPSNGSAVVDLRRMVLYVGHNFSDRIRFYSEIEIEHAISSAEDQGETEVEQAYLDGLITHRFNLRGGLILMPVGIINVYHEPPTFNGVDRPDVDVLLIPSTWREPGFGAFGELTDGLTYQLYLVNGFNANGFRSDTGIGDGHQEGQLAAARDFGGVLRLAFEPRLATIFGVSAYAATSGNSLRSTVGNVPVALVEADGRTRIRGFTARGQVAATFMGDSAALNRALAAGSTEQMAAVPVASRMVGGYVEAGYDLLRFFLPTSEQELTLFGRFDYVNTQSRVPAGFIANPGFKRYAYTAGLVYRPLPYVALKGDYRRREFGAGSGFNELAGAITWMF